MIFKNIDVEIETDSRIETNSAIKMDFKCAREGCKGKARWQHKGEYYCGRHCNSKVTDRIPIPIFEDEKKERNRINARRRREHNKTIEKARKKNNDKGRKGRVCCNKQPHYRDKSAKDKRHPLRKGYMNVSVCSGSKKWKALSPMYLGPVKIKEKKPDGTKLPYAKNIENYWQFAKVYDNEVEDFMDGKHVGECNKYNGFCQNCAEGFVVKDSYWETRRNGYLDDKAHRRKFPGASNSPLFSIFGGKRYGYQEARKFYCRTYSKLVRKTEEYKQLCSMIDNGYNIQIIGYDGVDVKKKYDNDWEAHYKDTSIPFGHESVITLLLKTKDEEDYEYPWD